MILHTSSGPLKLLIAVDGSVYTDAAVNWIASLELAGVAPHCVLTHVQQPLMSGEVGAILPASEVLAPRERASTQMLEQAADVIRGAGLPCTIDGKSSADPVAALLESARTHACDAMVVGRRGRGALHSALLGSVSAGVVGSARCPVFVVNASVAPLSSGRFGILLACDDAEPATRAAAFSVRLADQASTGKIHLLHVQPHPVVAGSVFAPRRIDVLSITRAEQALARARALIGRGKCDHAVYGVLNDVPGEAIARTVDDLDCSLIAMGTRGLGAASGFLLGSIAQHVVQLARVPVILSR